MRYWVISGIDGSGKTSVINALQEELGNRNLRSVCIWLRFNHYLTKILHAIARPLGLSVRVDNEMGRVWQHRFYRSKIFCTVYVPATFIDTALSRIKIARAKRAGTDIIICDRWIPDIIADLSVKMHRKDFLTSTWAKYFRRLVPAGTLQFIIFRDKQSILSSRLENRVDPDFELRYEVYDRLLKEDYTIAIDNNATIAESADQILKESGLNYGVK